MLYQNHCGFCQKQTTWCHDDMSIDSTFDRCVDCGCDAFEVVQRKKMSGRVCVCGESMKNSFIALGLKIDWLDSDEALCSRCFNLASNQIRVDDDFDKYGFEDNWVDA